MARDIRTRLFDAEAAASGKETAASVVDMTAM
jgi:hypothetical protein